MPYMNATDSTEGFQDSDNLVLEFDSGYAGVKEEKDTEGNVTTEGIKATGGTCRCGCGLEVAAGSKFKPGHDAKLKGKLIRAALAGVQVEIRANGMQTEKSPLDAAKSNEFDFTVNVQSALDKQAHNARGQEVRDAEKAAKAAERNAAREAKRVEREQAKAAAKAEREAAKALKAEGAEQVADEAPVVTDTTNETTEAPKPRRRSNS